MTDVTSRKPCAACPWRRASAPGWLGSSTPEEFHAQSEAELLMPCHLTVDYDDPDWRGKLEEEGMVQCAGRAIYFANRCKLPRNPELIVAEPDRKNVFCWPEEFLNHHSQW